MRTEVHLALDKSADCDPVVIPYTVVNRQIDFLTWHNPRGTVHRLFIREVSFLDVSGETGEMQNREQRGTVTKAPF